MVSRIQILSQELQDQIAAGEVIERPASIVKELIENAIDSGATSIELEVGKGGIEKVRVTDNGCGMSPDDLKLCMTPHATSKIRSSEDLFQVNTLGFRGEALASIGSVARVRITSREPQSDTGWSWVRSAPRDEPRIVPHQHPTGTTVQIEDLFFNLPARRRFLKSPQTEYGHALQWFLRLALSHRRIAFTLIKDGKTVFELPADQSTEHRFHGLKLGDGGRLYSVEANHDDLELSGWLQSPLRSSSSPQDLFLFVNHRYVQDRLLRSAVLAGLRGVLEVRRFPVGVLFLQCRPNLLDVNVHPAKTEVRFLQPSSVFGWMEQVFATWSSVHPWTQFESAVELTVPASTPSHVDSNTPFVSWKPAFMPVSNTSANPISEKEERLPISGGSLGVEEVPALEPSKWEHHLGLALRPVLHRTLAGRPTLNESTKKGSNEVWSENFRILGQWKLAYILVEDGDDLWICDQHAVHERIRYEELKRKLARSETLEGQGLLLEIPLPLGSEDAEALERHSKLFQRQGWSWRTTTTEVFLKSHPGDMSSEDAVLFLKESLQGLREIEGTGVPFEESEHQKNHLMMATQACKGAVKSGDRLEPESLRSLMVQARGVRESAHCPHGRPSWVRLEFDEVSRLFHRG